MQLSPRFEQALAYATVIHAGQLRKGTDIPYISHLLAVAAIALEQGATEDEAIGALLHDAVEDGGGLLRARDIRTRFGNAVADIVDGCTDSTAEDPTHKLAWQDRKETYLRHLVDAPESVKLVSAADKLHNLRSILADYRSTGLAVFERFKAGRVGTLWYYDQLSTIFTAAAASAPRLKGLASEIARTLGDLNQETGFS